jgi:NADH-ubiquinone oxidoreductase chain 5
MWLICPILSVICSPYYLKFLTLFVVFMGGWLGYEIFGCVFGDNLFYTRLYGASSCAGSMWFIPFFSTYDVSYGFLR